MAAILDAWYVNYLSSIFAWLLATYPEKMGLIDPMVLYLVIFKMAATAAILDGWYANYLSSTLLWLPTTYPEKMGLIGSMVL